MFNKKTYGLVAKYAESEKKAKEYKARIMGKKQKVFEFEGRYDDICFDIKQIKGGKHSMRKSVAIEINEDVALSLIDDDVAHAIKLRQLKSKHSDFYMQLHTLKERIDVFQEVFMRPDSKRQKRKDERKKVSLINYHYLQLVAQLIE